MSTTAPTQLLRPPSLLLQQRRFIPWHREVSSGGKPTKKPDWSTNDLSRCLSWPEVQHLPRNTEQGVGFVFTGGVFTPDKKLQLVGFDLDACRDTITCKIADWAVEVVEQLGNPWTQLSPSGTGFHIFRLCDPKELVGLKAEGKTPYAPMPNCGDKKTELRLFVNHGYMTMTLVPVPGFELTAKEIEPWA